MVGRGRAAAALLALAPLMPGCATASDPASILASAGGTGPEDAYVVTSVAQEYEILRLLGLQPGTQALNVVDGRAFDVLTASAPGGEPREVWFDISAGMPQF